MRTYQIAALALLCAFYIAYIAKMLLLRKQGIKGSILGKNALEKALIVVTYGGAALQFFSAVFPKLIWGFPSFPTMHEDGVILMALGVAAFIAAVITMKSNWRAGFAENQNTALVTGGIYRYSRNPAFVGFDLLYIGCALVFPNVLLIAGSLAALTLFHLQILSEERFLAAQFGEEYAAYRKTVLRYLGRH
ncbi:MAG: isoprenylcysteine carboxylmethyltransferase family protein [Oscillospiraceae bacterium]|jgi:protein-S-isoprenylcysteine O-methyltransferase Ste14|nr:isoprenylcysteine carboxylmethyltransferase family protein [Oscillospiraceae bacterium]